jgi:hypothetical protein
MQNEHAEVKSNHPVLRMGQTPLRKNNAKLYIYVGYRSAQTQKTE